VWGLEDNYDNLFYESSQQKHFCYLSLMLKPKADCKFTINVNTELPLCKGHSKKQIPFALEIILLQPPKDDNLSIRDKCWILDCSQTVLFLEVSLVEPLLKTLQLRDNILITSI